MEPSHTNSDSHEGQTEKLSKNALKKQKKQQEKEQKKAEQEQKKAEQDNKAGTAEEEETLNPREYYKNRVEMIKQLKEDKQYFPFPHKFETTHTIEELRNEFDSKITEKNSFTETVVAVAGRVYSIRTFGKFLIFIDLFADAEKIQVMVNKNSYGNDEQFEKLKEIVKRGDIVGAKGTIGRSKTGELTVLPTFCQLLSPCLHMLPKFTSKTTDSLTDQETRYRQRYLDLICNFSSRDIFITRSRFISLLRQLLTEKGFLEVETPILNLKTGGANAKPFKTKHNSLNLDMSMRVAPELFLKNCIVGGLNKVFEIGKNFRNEGMDPTHNPEFTACELYWAFADYQDLLTFTEQIIGEIVFRIKGSYKFAIHKDGKEIQLDFTAPWRRISVVEELEKILNVKFPSDFTTDEANKFLDELCLKNNVGCSNPRTPARLLDHLIAHYLEPQCINPTFLTEQPQVMCPLAKYHRSKPGLTERFELFINEKEYVNAYTELNDPFVQLEQFELQQVAKALGDQEANDVDEEFVKCLEHALPPTGGWGLGIDRLCMLLVDKQNIQEVILFPAMKPLDHHEKITEITEEEKNTTKED